MRRCSRPRPTTPDVADFSHTPWAGVPEVVGILAVPDRARRPGRGWPEGRDRVPMHLAPADLRSVRQDGLVDPIWDPRAHRLRACRGPGPWIRRARPSSARASGPTGASCSRETSSCTRAGRRSPCRSATPSTSGRAVRNIISRPRPGRSCRVSRPCERTWMPARPRSSAQGFEIVGHPDAGTKDRADHHGDLDRRRRRRCRSPPDVGPGADPRPHGNHQRLHGAMVRRRALGDGRGRSDRDRVGGRRRGPGHRRHLRLPAWPARPSDHRRGSRRRWST